MCYLDIYACIYNTKLNLNIIKIMESTDIYKYMIKISKGCYLEIVCTHILVQQKHFSSSSGGVTSFGSPPEPPGAALQEQCSSTSDTLWPIQMRAEFCGIQHYETA